MAGHTSSVLSLTFAPHENVLTSGSADGTVRLWTMG
ncbi:WD40 repeat domain-containing protein [Frankia sp. CiP3]